LNLSGCSDDADRTGRDLRPANRQNHGDEHYDKRSNACAIPFEQTRFALLGLLLEIHFSFLSQLKL
jgi:hypothetical protein